VAYSGDWVAEWRRFMKRVCVQMWWYWECGKSKRDKIGWVFGHFTI